MGRGNPEDWSTGNNTRVILNAVKNPPEGEACGLAFPIGEANKKPLYTNNA